MELAWDQNNVGNKHVANEQTQPLVLGHGSESQNRPIVVKAK
jgi:hypothetical protein